MDILTPQALVSLVALGLIGLMLLVSKVFTRIWLYILLLSPSWSMTAYNILDGILKGETNTAVLSNGLGFIFVLYPIDTYLVGSPALSIYGAVLLGIWFYIILITSIKLLGGWMLPVTPLIFYILGKGLPHTMNLIASVFPASLGFLFVLSGLPFIILLCLLLGALTYFIKRRRKL